MRHRVETTTHTVRLFAVPLGIEIVASQHGEHGVVRILAMDGTELDRMVLEPVRRRVRSAAR